MASATRELLHVSYGSLPAHLSTHHFNAQTAYFDYSPNAPEPLVDHDISWQAGQDPSGRDRYTPRWLAYDVRAGFSGLRRDDDEGDVDQEREAVQSTWQSAPEVVRVQDARPYQTPFRNLTNRSEQEDFDWDAELEKQFDSDDEEYDEQAEEQQQVRAVRQGGSANTQSIAASTSASGPSRQRPWSRNLLFEPHPSSLVPVTAAGGLPLESLTDAKSAADCAAQGTEVFESFEQGYARAQSWENDHETFEGSFRSMMEVCDRPQGFNVAMQSSDAWAGFSAYNLEMMADEYPKLDKIGWAMRWGQGLGDVIDKAREIGDAEARLARVRSMNEALSLLLLTESLSLYVPMAVPRDIELPWARHLRDSKKPSTVEDPYYASSILASQFETVTLGARLRNSPTAISDIVSRLTWRGDTPLASLGGCFPMPNLSTNATSASLDPIDALLASRGYNPKPFAQGGASGPSPDLGASKIVQFWTSFSNAAAVVPTRGRKRQRAPNVPPSQPKPYALCSMHRDASLKDERIARDLRESVDYWVGTNHTVDIEPDPSKSLAMDEPWAASNHAPLSFPVTASFPRIFQDLDLNGHPLPEGAEASLGEQGQRRRPRPLSLPLLSTLSTTPASLPHLLHANSILSMAIESHLPLASWGLGRSSGANVAANDESEGRIGGRDGLKDLRERCEELRSAYEEEGAMGYGGSDGEDGRGTDEEWGDDRDGGEDDGLDWD